MINIGVMGLLFKSGNKGCSALSYSFLQILDTVLSNKKEKATVFIFVPQDLKRYYLKPGYRKSFLPQIEYNYLKCKIIPLEKGKFSFITENAYKKCKFVFDFTAGDSFSDIYGRERILADLYYKEGIIKHSMLVLGSQTYGPFKDKEIEERAIRVIKNSYEVFSRDSLSYDLVKKIAKRDPVLTSDIAFEMRGNDNIIVPENTKIKIGINPSGLLWSGGYTQNNQFGLKVNFREYCMRLISYLSSNDVYEIHLIPHVFTTNPSIVDNDLIACKELKEQFPNLIIAPCFELPMDIKGYIAKMDCFIGARMHATIAALSSGVATIPFSYSRKFEGLYGSLEYNFLISATEIETMDAINKTIDYINRFKELESAATISANIASKKNIMIYNRVQEILGEYCEKNIKYYN